MLSVDSDSSMQTQNITDWSQAQTVLWERFHARQVAEQLPHAFLLLGARYSSVFDFAWRMACCILCWHESNKPCGECKSCHLMRLATHPDCLYLQPDKPGGVIKIDLIRELQSVVYTSPQLNHKRVIMIHPAEKMNGSAANALLKLLEEPPENVIFILIAEQLSSLLPTIISRCQQWRFPCEELLEDDYLAVGTYYTSDSGRAKIVHQLATILSDLISLFENRLSVCELAIKWSDFDLADLLWLIYLVNAQLINDQLCGIKGDQNMKRPELKQLAYYLKPVHLFKQLDQINTIMNQLNRNMNVNQTLVLENFLLCYTLGDNYVS